MRRFLLFSFTLALLLCASSLALAEEPVTLASLKAAGVAPMSKDEVLALTKKRMAGEVGQWSQQLNLHDDGTLRGQSCPKNSSCSDAAKGTGKWSVEDDGTLRLFLDWGRWGKHDWIGKLYVHGGYAYQHDGQDESSRAIYRFKL